MITFFSYATSYKKENMDEVLAFWFIPLLTLMAISLAIRILPIIIYGNKNAPFKRVLCKLSYGVFLMAAMSGIMFLIELLAQLSFMIKK